MGVVCTSHARRPRPRGEAAAALSLSHRNAVSVSNLFMNDLSSHRVRYLLAPHAAHSDVVGFLWDFVFRFFTL